jgi:hypothetical protein
MREAFVVRQSVAPATFPLREFNFDSPMLDSTALWLKSNMQKAAATLRYG